MEKKKRILIVCQYFYPESFRINELAFELVKRGHHVDVLTGIPNYPDGVYFKGYGIFRKRHEIINGVNIYRCFHTPRGRKASNLALSINYLSYMFCASLLVSCHFAWKKKYDVAISYAMSPITQVIPACFLGMIRGTKVLTWIQDIWPDSITDNTTPTQEKFLLPPLDAITNFVYRHSDKILISSKKMASMINRKHNFSECLEYVPNWCDDFSIIKEPLNIDVPSGHKIMMAGNLGEGIGPDDVLSVAECLKDIEDIHFLFAGSGSRVDYMKEQAKVRGLPNIHFLGRFSYDQMGAVYANADSLFLVLKPSCHAHLDVTVPSRLQAYMSAGKPVFAMIGSGAKEVIETADCGFVAPAGDYKRLAQLIRDNYKNVELLKRKGENARKAFLRDFTLEQGLAHFEKLLNIS